MWNVEATDEFVSWIESLDERQWNLVKAAVDLLERHGPTFGRPYVDTLVGSELPNLKELRPRESHLRFLFVFDPRRTAILLLGGDKTGRWGAWYREHSRERSGSTGSTWRNCARKES